MITASAAMYLPLDGRLRVLLPRMYWLSPSGRRASEMSSFDKGRWLRRMCGSGSHVEYEPDPFPRWLVRRRHFSRLLLAVPERCGPTVVAVDRRKRYRCDERCQQACRTPPEECECACLGRFHGGGWAGIPWDRVGERLISDEVVRLEWVQQPPNSNVIRMIRKERTA